MKTKLMAVATAGLIALVGCKAAESTTEVIDNENVRVEYVENAAGQTVSDAPISNDGRSVLIAPDVPDDNQPYTYEITEVTGNEIHGVPIDGEESDDNGGIFLYQSELDFDVQEGDLVTVVWGEYEDEFKSIMPAGGR